MAEAVGGSAQSAKRRPRFWFAAWGARPHRGTTIIAWRARSPSTPAQARPYEASGVDRSARLKQRGPSCHQYGGAPRSAGPE